MYSKCLQGFRLRFLQLGACSQQRAEFCLATTPPVKLLSSTRSRAFVTNSSGPLQAPILATHKFIASLVAKRFNRIQLGSLASRIEAEEHSDGHREQHCDGD